MHLHTRAYVKKKPHVPVVTCVGSSVAGLGPQAPCGIRPRLLTNPEPHTWFLRVLRPLHLARGRIMAGIWTCGHAASCACSRPRATASVGPGRKQARRHRHFQREHKPRPAGRRPRKQGPIREAVQTAVDSSSSSAGRVRGHAQQQDKAKRATAKRKQSGTGMSLTGFVSQDTVNAERDCTRLYTNAECELTCTTRTRTR